MAFAGMLSAFLLFVAAICAFEEEWKGAGACALLATGQLGIALAAYGRLRTLRTDADKFLARLEGCALDEAISIAKSEAVALPSGLIAEKVEIPHSRWWAFERGAFQCVIAIDEQGKARTFLI